MTMTIGTVRGGKNQRRDPIAVEKTGGGFNSVDLILRALKLIRNDQEMIWEHEISVFLDIFVYEPLRRSYFLFWIVLN